MLPMKSGETIQVSVVCMAYNQAGYIRQCLDSLISQEFNHPYEVIVHDDASTDGTREIIEEYARMHPDTVVPFLEDENQHSKGADIASLIVGKARGRFIALCEGDDWWTDPLKIQRQYDYMSVHPECSLCVHAAHLYDDAHHRYFGRQGLGDEDRDVPLREIIEKGGGVFATNSMMMRRELYARPSLYQGWGIGDYPLSIYCAMGGRVRYLSSTSSAYRVNARGSWSVSMKTSKTRAIDRNERTMAGLRRFDQATGYVYHSSVMAHEKGSLAAVYVLNGEWGLLCGPEMSEWRRQQGISHRAILWVTRHLGDRAAERVRSAGRLLRSLSYPQHV